MMRERATDACAAAACAVRISAARHWNGSAFPPGQAYPSPSLGWAGASARVRLSDPRPPCGAYGYAFLTKTIDKAFALYYI